MLRPGLILVNVRSDLFILCSIMFNTNYKIIPELLYSDRLNSLYYYYYYYYYYYTVRFTCNTLTRDCCCHVTEAAAA